MSTNTANKLVAGVEVKLKGAMLDPTLQERLVEVRVEDNLSLPDSFELRISDPDLTVVDRADFAIGTEVQISFAGKAANALKKVLVGEIASLEPEFGKDAVLVVRGYDLSHRMNRTRVAETYQQMTYGDIAKKVFGRQGLRVGTVDHAGGPSPFLQQNNQTDWEFLWSLARKIDFEVVIEEKTGHFRKGSTKVSGPALKWGETLRSFRPRVTGVQQPTQVIVRGWDPKAKKEIVGQGKASPASFSSTNGFDQKKLAKDLAGGIMRITNSPVGSPEQATKMAEGLMARLANSFLEATGVAEGDPALRAGVTVKIDGVGTKFSGDYKLSATTHLYRSATGYETRFTIGGRSPRSLVDLMNKSRPKSFGNSVVVGIVSNNKDPENLGRVRVKLPELGDESESFWARVVQPSAGNQRGLNMIPQVNDEVVIAFLHDQPEYPYVLGSVWNGRDKPDADQAKPDGSLRVRSDHDVDVKAVENITLVCDKDLTITAKGKVTQTSTGDVTVETKGKASQKSTGETTIEAMSITIKGQGKITIQATGPLELKGNTVKIDGGPMVTVTGALIKLG